jgi:hypothetical protein
VRINNMTPASQTNEHEGLYAGLPGGAKHRDDRAHRVTEQPDLRVRDALASECDHRLQLQHLFDPERDRRAIAARHAAIRVEDHVESLAPQRGRDAERVLALALMTPRDDDGLRRPRLSKVPGAEVDTVGRHQLDLFRVGLELERREGEVVEGGRRVGYECPPVELVRQGDVQHQHDRADNSHVSHLTDLQA